MDNSDTPPELHEITPDRYMERTVESLLNGMYLIVSRFAKNPKIYDEVPWFAEREKKMAEAYSTVIRVKAAEVVEFTDELGLDFTVDDVRKDPFLVAVRAMNVLKEGLEDAQD